MNPNICYCRGEWLASAWGRGVYYLRKDALLLGGFVGAVQFVLLGAVVEPVLVGLHVVQGGATGLDFVAIVLGSWTGCVLGTVLGTGAFIGGSNRPGLGAARLADWVSI